MKQILLLFFLISFIQLSFADSFVDYSPNEIAIKLSAPAMVLLDKDLISSGLTGIEALDHLNQQYSFRTIKPFFRHFKMKKHRGRQNELDRWYKIVFSESVDVVEVAEDYQALSEIEIAEAIAIHKAFIMPNDPNFNQQWHLHQANDADVDAPEAWDIFTGNPNIIVAMMDTGVRWYHKDLAGAYASENDRNTIRGNIWVNAGELQNTNPNADEDGNGYPDDWVGWDFVTGNPQLFNVGDDYDVEDNDPRDYNGHGTHCAGNVAAINNNNRGVGSVGGGWGEDVNGFGNGVKVMCLRIGWDDLLGGYVRMDFAANAFIYAADNGARIASCSWGSSQQSALVDAVNYFLYGTTTPTPQDEKQRLIFVAAGNNNNETSDYLTSRNDVIAVAGTNENDNKWNYSSFGTWVDISAPASNIYSTVHNSSSPGTDAYTSYSGTSMATPIVASVAALVWSYNPLFAAAEVEDILYQSADNIEANLAAQHKGKMGAGRVNAYNAIILASGGVNSVPVALNDSARTDEDVAVVINVLRNDFDPDGDPLTISAVGLALHGRAVQNGDSSIIYTPGDDYFGEDSLRYYISDGRGGIDSAMVHISISSINDPPQIVDLPEEILMLTDDSTFLDMSAYQYDVDTPAERLTWTFEVSSDQISYSFDEASDSLTIYSHEIPGQYFLYATLTDDSAAFDQDTIMVIVDIPSALSSKITAQPDQFRLFQNYPNPFNPKTAISYQLPVRRPDGSAISNVELSIYNLWGQKVATLVSASQPAGHYEVTWDATGFSSGIYMYRLETNTGFSQVKKLVLLK